MFLLIDYEYGNGYYCSCCRQVFYNSVQVNSKEDAFEESKKIHDATKGDYKITGITGTGSEGLLEEIENYVKSSVTTRQIDTDIETTKKLLDEVEEWFTNLEENRKNNNRKLIFYRNQLKRLEEMKNDKTETSSKNT